jgi:hypothetical protein
MATTAQTSTSDLELQVEQLKADLAAAEAARFSDADRRAADVRDQLKAKQNELRAQQAAEDVANAQLRRKQELETLHQLENDERETHALLLAMRAESVSLAQRIALTEFKDNELLRQHGQLKAKLEI